MLEETQPKPPLGLTYDPSAKAKTLGTPGLNNAAEKVQFILERMKGAENNRSMALETVAKCAAYRRNLWLIDSEASGPEPKLLKEEEEYFGRDYRAIPWTIVLAWLRQGSYMALKPRWDWEAGAGRESDRYVAEMFDLLNTVAVAPARQREYRMLVDLMGFGAHSVLKVEWDANAGREVRIEEETDEEPKTGKPTVLRTEKRPSKSVVNATMSLAGLAEREMVETPIYHKLDEFGRGMYKVRKTGGVRFTALGPTSYNIDPNAGARGIRDARWFYDQTPITADKMHELYAGNEEVLGRLRKWDGWSDNLCISATDRMVRDALGKPTSAAGSRVTTLVNFYMLGSPEHGLPNGLFARLLLPSGGQADTAFLVEYKDHPWRIPAADGAVEVFDSNDYWGVQLMAATAPAQKESNELLSLALESVKDGISMVVGGRDKSGDSTGIRVSELDNVPGGKKVAWGTDIEDVKLLTTQIQAKIQTELMDKVMQMGEFVGSNRATRTDREELAAQVARAIQQDKTITGMALQSLADCLLEATLLAFELIQRHMSKADIERLLEDYSDVEVQDLVDCDIRSSLRATLRGASLSDDPAWILTLMRFIPQLGPAWEKIYPPGVLADMLAMEKKFGRTPRDAQREKAQRENSMMRKGKVNVHPFDDGEVHLAEHDYWCVRQWKWLVQEKFKDEFNRQLKHREEHEELEAEKLTKAAVRAAEAELAIGAAVQKIRDEAADRAKGPLTRTTEAQPPEGGPPNAS